MNEKFGELIHEFGEPGFVMIEIHADEAVEFVVHPLRKPIVILWKWSENDKSITTYFPCGCQIGDDMASCDRHSLSGLEEEK